MRRLVAAVAVVAACTSPTPLPSSTTAPAPTTTGPVVTTSTTVPPLNLLRGGVGLVGVESAGTQLAVITVVPTDFEVGEERPVVLALPPGDQGLDTTTSVVDGIYEEQALARGWVVVSPVAPGGVSFWQGSEVHVEVLLDWIEEWVVPEGGRVHLLGVSNGGISAFKVAMLHPDRVASLVVFPGYPRAGDPLESVAHLPIRMFVGGADEPWLDPMQQTFDDLEMLGADVTYEIVPGAPHFIPELADGVVLFDTLDSLRASQDG